MSSHENQLYKSGYKCREARGGAAECPHGFNSMKMRSFWLAGWHDSDMSHGVRMFNF